MDLRLLVLLLLGAAVGALDPYKGTLKFLLQEIAQLHLHREVRIDFLHLSDRREYKIYYDNQQFRMTHYVPRLNDYIGDMHHMTEFKSYLKDVHFDFQNRSCQTLYEQLSSTVIERVTQRADAEQSGGAAREERLKYHYNYTVAECTSFYRVHDFQEEDDRQDITVNLTALETFLVNRYAVQMPSVGIYALVLPPKSLLAFKLQLAEQLRFRDGFFILESAQQHLPIYVALLNEQDLAKLSDQDEKALRLRELSQAYIAQFAQLVDWELDDFRVTQLDRNFTLLFEQFHRGIVARILSDVTSGSEILETKYRITEIFYAADYLQLSLKIIELQEHVFLSRQWASVLQFKRALQQLKEAKAIFENDIMPLLKKNLIGKQGQPIYARGRLFGEA